MRIVRRFGALAAFVLLWSLLVGVVGEVVSPAPAGAVGEGSFQALTPSRLLDTRSGVGAPAVKVGPGQTLVLQVSGRGGVPTVGAGAVSVNVTATQPSASSFLTVWPTGVARPTASTLNFVAGQTIANSTVVGLSADGKLSLFNASGSTHVVVDVSGWFPVGGDFTALTPARLLDTRSGVGAPAVKVGPGQTVVLQVAGRGGVPGSGVGAVSLNITATQPTLGSYLTAWPTGTARPTASILNFPSGQTIANSTVVGLSADGKLSLFNASGSTHVVVDVSGWFPVGGDFTALTPARLLDTRSGVGAPAVKVGPGQTLVLQVTGRGGVPASGVGAVSVNITATQPSMGSYLTVWPTGAARPTTSILNFPAGRAIANSAIVGLSFDGKLSLFNSSGSTHVLVDVSGWFPIADEVLRNVAQLAGGLQHTCALMGDRTVKCWGDNSKGQLGDGTTTNRPRPKTVQGLSGVTQLSMGFQHSCALMAGGTVKCWGRNLEAQLGDGTRLSRNNPTSVPGLSGVIQVSSGWYHSCALLTGGTVKCWGLNANGQLGDGTNVDRLAPTDASGLPSVASLSMGSNHSCALLTGGSVQCWGFNDHGQLGDGTTQDRHSPVWVAGLSNVTDLTLGEHHSCVLLSGGVVKCWGRNATGQLGDGTMTNRSMPVALSGPSGVTQLAAGGAHTCGLLSGETAICWGQNLFGSLGDGTDQYRLAPVVVSGLSDVTRLALGGGHSCASLAGGTAKCWGLNNFSQIGDNSIIDRLSPVWVVP